MTICLNNNNSSNSSSNLLLLPSERMGGVLGGCEHVGRLSNGNMASIYMSVDKKHKIDLTAHV